MHPGRAWGEPCHAFLAVDAAERMAGVQVQSVIVGMTGGRLTSQFFDAKIAVGGHEVEDERQVSQARRAIAAQRGQEAAAKDVGQRVAFEGDRDALRPCVCEHIRKSEGWVLGWGVLEGKFRYAT